MENTNKNDDIVDSSMTFLNENEAVRDPTEFQCLMMNSSSNMEDDGDDVESIIADLMMANTHELSVSDTCPVYDTDGLS